MDSDHRSPAAPAARGRAEPSADFTRQRTADVLAAKLRRRIVDGDLDQGDRLMTEPELERTYGVSRPTIRQALSMLEREGLIVVRHGARGGAVVRRPSVEIAARYAGYVMQSRGVRLADVYASRMQFEPPVVRELAARHSREDVKVLRALIQAEDEGGYDPIDAPERFRRTLAELSPNAANAVFLAVLGEIAHQQGVLTRKRRTPADVQRFIEVGHQMRSELVDLIEAGDADAAEALWRDYIANTQRVLGRDLLQRTVDVLG